MPDHWEKGCDEYVTLGTTHVNWFFSWNDILRPFLTRFRTHFITKGLFIRCTSFTIIFRIEINIMKATKWRFYRKIFAIVVMSTRLCLWAGTSTASVLLCRLPIDTNTLSPTRDIWSPISFKRLEIGRFYRISTPPYKPPQLWRTTYWLRCCSTS